MFTPLVERKAGVLVLDDTTLDKPYAKKMEFPGTGAASTVA